MSFAFPLAALCFPLTECNLCSLVGAFFSSFVYAHGFGCKIRSDLNRCFTAFQAHAEFLQTKIVCDDLSFECFPLC